MAVGVFTELCKEDDKISILQDSPVCSRTSIYTLNIIASCLLGFFGANFSWNGQYLFISKVDAKHTGRYFAMFFTFFQFTNVAGNIFNYSFYYFSSQKALYFGLFFGVCVTCGIVFFLLPHSIEEKQSIDSVEVKDPVSKSLLETFSSTYHLFRRTKLIRLVPFMVLSGTLQGLMQAFMYKITERVEGESEANRNISITMICYGVSGVITSQLLQTILEKLKPSIPIIGTTLGWLICSIMLVLVYYYPSKPLLFSVFEEINSS